MDKPLSALDWTLVQAFLAVAETGSLSGAARALGSSQPTLGRQVRTLEETLGVPLFTRRPRGLSLTETGQALLGPAQEMRRSAGQMSLIAAGRAERLSGVVRVTASVWASLNILPPIVAEIRPRHPEIELEIVASDRTENLLFREADLAIRMYRPEQLEVISAHLGDVAMGLYAAPPYLDRIGRPDRFERLTEFDFVGYDTSEEIIRGMHEAGFKVDRHFFGARCDDNGVYWELVRAGCGLGFAVATVADRDPAVERVFPETEFHHMPIWLTAHKELRNTPRLRRVWDMIAEGLKPYLS
ncbi:MAG TPA: LysR family transcriptional regulator [Aliiroseovarius sp.]|nr:LysR family transcriptional regulator [Aliiroseovarius sp.]